MTTTSRPASQAPNRPPAQGTILARRTVTYPDCRVPDHQPLPHGVDVTTVLVADGRGDYAAYRGVGPEQHIVWRGAKLRYKEALELFGPELVDEDHYRR